MKNIKNLIEKEALKKLPFHASLWEFYNFDKSAPIKNKILIKRYHKQITRINEYNKEDIQSL